MVTPHSENANVSSQGACSFPGSRHLLPLEATEDPFNWHSQGGYIFSSSLILCVIFYELLNTGAPIFGGQRTEALLLFLEPSTSWRVC